MFKKLISIILLVFILTACSNGQSSNSVSTPEEIRIGILLSDAGLGDESFNDSAFRGLERARDELGILFDYKEAPDGDFEGRLNELVNEKYDLVIGLGFSVQETLEKVAKENPKQPFLLIDGVSSLENVVSITFKENEGSFLVGMIAAMITKTNTLGFIGGADVPVIHHFEKGFIQGAKYVNPEINILQEYANSFSEPKVGSEIAEKQIEQGADFIYPAAGFTGFGTLKTAQSKGIYTAGVDTDQYFVAEKAVVTSMLKNIDVAVYNIAKELVDKGSIEASSYQLGLVEEGVGLAEIRNITLTSEQKSAIEEATDKIKSGSLQVDFE
ncbi:BMP family ABC transporter substrate-binding protein [Cytobacillus spongiae]|uniref:BMP family lipoprotein n=1 Tax=Cytobacillus spongiae TaxID=2901381 RepID=UPI001F2CFFD3|nr:BMP family ABC transporter substrate-binding protein [Cytobacillus spongiae]UII55603.1 BMP family ABC transporter substrate-binding protein [Cytobacillus spongiae]